MEHSHPTSIIQNFKTTHHVKIIRKIDRPFKAKLKKECLEFMSSGRSAFNSQLIKWQEFFAENCEDIYAIHTIAEKLQS